METSVDFKAGASGLWQDHDLSTYGVGPGQVAEIVIANSTQTIQWFGGVRTDGSGIDRRLDVHEAESGGYDMGTTHVNADMCWKIDWYGEDVSDYLHF